MNAVVVNKQRDHYDVYIGRPSPWGNPWSHLRGSAAEFIVPTREIAIENFKKWIWGTDFTDVLQNERWWILNHLGDLKGQRLACWCRPDSCHGDIYLEILNNWDYGLTE